ncbi:permease prefix domain 1-containing protein [Dactylosporangium sp. CS-033363]|uniref:permease prefix domain 1-containing protein n=1 Tax=Dactylosporangium sp. CS-033363 TaxID=3239935 RepID=UPI003D8CB273
MTAPLTLTDRYIDAALRRLPEHQRPDLEQELRTSIADAVDARVERGTEFAEAERAVLTELGDPARLAAGYADRPLHLIGPQLYLEYTRLLTTLLAVVVPAVAGFVGLLRTLSGESTAWEIALATGGAVVTTAVHVAFWTTLLFVLLERAGSRGRAWTPAALPEEPPKRLRYFELTAETLLLVVISAFILLSPYVSPQSTADGAPIGLFAPWLWKTGVVYLFIALAGANLAASFAKYHIRWSVPRALAGSLVGVAGALVLVWLAARDRLVNPDFAAAAGWGAGVTRWINLGLVIAGTLSVLSAVLEHLNLARRRS